MEPEAYSMTILTVKKKVMLEKKIIYAKNLIWPYPCLLFALRVNEDEVRGGQVERPHTRLSLEPIQQTDIVHLQYKTENQLTHRP
jgi:hypothetical protein